MNNLLHLLIFLILYAATAESGYYCGTIHLKCPDDHKAFLNAGQTGFDASTVAATERFICLGDYDVTCKEDTSSGCFPSTSKVHMANNSTTLMKDLKVNDMVLDANLNPTPVLGWMHREPEEFLRVTVLNDRLQTSPNHLIKTSKGFEFAGDLTMNYHLMRGTKKIPITTISHARLRGIYAPYTKAGTITVDGYAVSCYADVASHSFAHWVMNFQYETGLMVTEDLIVRRGLGNRVMNKAEKVIPSMFYKAKQ